MAGKLDTALRIARTAELAATSRAAGLVRRGEETDLAITRIGDHADTNVDRYWSEHTVAAERFLSVRQSERFLKWRFDEYPLFREFCGLWGDHSGEVVLDYGCGPGNDVVGLAAHSGAKQVIGVDISSRALALARDRLALHRIGAERTQLVQTADGEIGTGLEDESVDYAQSMGVIHHTSDPVAVIAEIHRVLKPGGRARIMVYNRDSVWVHLYTAYERQIVEGAFAGLDIEAAFARNTDGEHCPIARCHPGPEFLGLCEQAGFEGRYVGGYLSKRELQSLRESYGAALADDRLADEHRDFLRSLRADSQGLPMYEGFHAGIGGVYSLTKAV